MKIYQIHEVGGEWEDSYDLIVGSYLKPRKAEVECQRLQAKEDKRIARARKCNNCPLYNGWGPLTEQIIETTKRYCPYFVYEEYDRCLNGEFDMDERHFDVQEVEVIE